MHWHKQHHASNLCSSVYLWRMQRTNWSCASLPVHVHCIPRCKCCHNLLAAQLAAVTAFQDHLVCSGTTSTAGPAELPARSRATCAARASAAPRSCAPTTQPPPGSHETTLDVRLCELQWHVLFKIMCPSQPTATRQPISNARLGPAFAASAAAGP